MKKSRVILIAHNIRSCYNVGSILRSADGLGVAHVYLAGYTPYPTTHDDSRLPHIAAKIDRQIHKTALGAQATVAWSHEINTLKLIKRLKDQGTTVAALEQTPQALDLADFRTAGDIALVVGNEIDGLEPDILGATFPHLQIAMEGRKESLNVSVAAAIGLYQLTRLKA
ncbi:MAG: TrmH family RNA methyltransferase [Candidatus Saccharimonadales bacterium]